MVAKTHSTAPLLNPYDLPVHPAAQRFRMMDRDELDGLTAVPWTAEECVPVRSG